MIVGQIVKHVIIVGYERDYFSYGIKSLYVIKYFLLEEAIFRIIKLHITKLEVCMNYFIIVILNFFDSILAYFFKTSISVTINTY